VTRGILISHDHQSDHWKHREGDATGTTKFKVEFARTGKVAFATANVSLLELIEAEKKISTMDVGPGPAAIAR
jgi:hypothetical protein